MYSQNISEHTQGKEEPKRDILQVKIKKKKNQTEIFNTHFLTYNLIEKKYLTLRRQNVKLNFELSVSFD